MHALAKLSTMTAMSQDPGPLALVIGDPLAPKVLAWWAAKMPQGKVDERVLCRACMASLEQVSATVERCELAGLLLHDGTGISVLGRRWLNQHVARELGLAQPAKSKERGSVAVAAAVAVAIAAGLLLVLSIPIRDSSHRLGGERTGGGLDYSSGT